GIGMNIELKGVDKSFDGNKVLKGMDLFVKDGSLVCLFGPSGCGKTTSLKIIAGLLQLDNGLVLFDNKDVTSLPPEERNTGFVPQNYALFPHLTVENNISFGLEVRNYSKEEIKNRIEELLKLIDLKGFENRYPRELSGGQQQKVAVARALAFKPSVLLLDEPLASIDIVERVRLRNEIKNIKKRTGATILYVTHDVEEAFSISDDVAIIEDGKIRTYGKPSILKKKFRY
ncbi:MAG: ABC transporter ATP-binding protein, partial [Candidatus Aenigmarchaeota archaeon]|nr:ABC transporter ATP-binding protein [Candidatus Aenigmarchaeota archaeon]